MVSGVLSPVPRANYSEHYLQYYTSTPLGSTAMALFTSNAQAIISNTNLLKTVAIIERKHTVVYWQEDAAMRDYL